MDGGPGFESHLAYCERMNFGNWPPGSDRRLLGLMYETIFATGRFKGIPGSFVLGNGDPTGYGYREDFIAATKDNTLERTVEKCNFGPEHTGMMRDRPNFSLNDPKANECHLETPQPAAIAAEDTHDPIPDLQNGIQDLCWPWTCAETVIGESNAGGSSIVVCCIDSEVVDSGRVVVQIA